MKELLGKGGPKLFTPWLALQDLELSEHDNIGVGGNDAPLS
jgi:hypothetical protein